MLIENVKKDQRVRLARTDPCFGSEHQAAVCLDALGLEEIRRLDAYFWKNLEGVSVKKGSEGTVINSYSDGWVDVLFDGFDEPFDIPAHCLDEIEEEKK